MKRYLSKHNRMKSAINDIKRKRDLYEELRILMKKNTREPIGFLAKTQC